MATFDDLRWRVYNYGEVYERLYRHHRNSRYRGIAEEQAARNKFRSEMNDPALEKMLVKEFLPVYSSSERTKRCAWGGIAALVLGLGALALGEATKDRESAQKYLGFATVMLPAAGLLILIANRYFRGRLP